MADMWNAPSDLDYRFGDLPACDDPDRDPEYEAWLADHGYLDVIEDDAWEAHLREEWDRSQAARYADVTVIGADDDVAF